MPYYTIYIEVLQYEFFKDFCLKNISLEDINYNLINAVISVEDKNFYQHHGFDYLRIAKAMYLNIKNGKITQGASTISQQYIKNI